MNLITFMVEMQKLARDIYGCPRKVDLEKRSVELDFTGRRAEKHDVAHDCYMTLINAGYEAKADVQCEAGKVIVQLKPASYFGTDADSTRGLLF